MADLHDAIAAEAERTAFSGVVRVDRGAETLVAQAFGLADRGREVPNTVGNPVRAREWREGLHGARGDVALSRTARLALDTTARSVLGDDLPLIDDDCHGRAPARAPIRDRRLPRRGRDDRRQRRT